MNVATPKCQVAVVTSWSNDAKIWQLKDLCANCWNIGAHRQKNGNGKNLMYIRILYVYIYIDVCCNPWYNIQAPGADKLCIKTGLAWPQLCLQQQPAPERTPKDSVLCGLRLCCWELALMPSDRSGGILKIEIHWEAVTNTTANWSAGLETLICLLLIWPQLLLWRLPIFR